MKQVPELKLRNLSKENLEKATKLLKSKKDISIKDLVACSSATTIALYCGLPPNTFSTRVKNPMTFRVSEIITMADCFGVSYARMWEVVTR